MVLKLFPILYYCQRKIMIWLTEKKNLESSIWGKEAHLKSTFPALIICSKQSHFFLWVLHIVLSFMGMLVICHAHNESRINTDFCYYSIIYSLRLLFTFLSRLCSITSHLTSVHCTLSPRSTRMYVMWAEENTTSWLSQSRLNQMF